MGSSADQQGGVADERHGDGDALSHAAAELVRIVARAVLGVGDAERVEQLRRCAPQASAFETPVWARQTRAICSPTGISGFSEATAFW